MNEDEAYKVYDTRRRAYEAVFKGPKAETVLADLKRFCHAETSTFDADPRIHAFREGRREVWLRIQSYMALTEEQVRAFKEKTD